MNGKRVQSPNKNTNCANSWLTNPAALASVSDQFGDETPLIAFYIIKEIICYFRLNN